MSGHATARPKVRVLIVDDSAFMRTALARMISSEKDFEVVATASSGADALQKIPSLMPDVVTLDVEMPGLDGLATLRRIMSRFPRPVIMVSAVTEENAEITFTALSAGAFDFLPKRMSPSSLEIAHIRSDLVDKIRAAAIAHRSRSQQVDLRKPPASATLESHYSASAVPAVVALGTSTGGPRALQQILPRFPRDLSVPILIVQHMPSGFTGPFALRLKGMCAIDVREAKDGEPVESGVAYIAPACRHMRVERRSTDSRPAISLKTDSADELHIPSADILMSSVAEVYRGRAIGVIMTGMGCDGAQGMQAIHRQGGFTIGQDETTCTVYGMPRACAELGILDCVLPLDHIPAEILRATRRRRLA